MSNMHESSSYDYGTITSTIDELHKAVNEITESSSTVEINPSTFYFREEKQAKPSFSDAMRIITEYFNNDSELAWAWHCYIAGVLLNDGFPHETANKIAATLMEELFSVRTREHPYYKEFEKQWKQATTPRSFEQNETRETKEELGVIQSVQFGLGDKNIPCVYMIVKTLNGEALLVFENEHALDFVKQTKATNINNLVGKTCVVIIKDSIMQFLRMFD